MEDGVVSTSGVVRGGWRAAVGRLRSVRAGWWSLVVPALFTVGMMRARPRHLYDTVDGNLVTGIVRNLRCCGSLSSPVDQYWLRLDMATTYRHLPRVRVADLGPLYPLFVAILPLSVDRAMWLVNVVSGLAALVLVAVLVHRATGSWAAGVAAQVLVVAGPTQHTGFGSVTWSNLVGTTVYDVTAVACLLGAMVASASPRRAAQWATGVLWAAACLVKPSLVVVLCAVLVWRVVVLRRGATARGGVPALAAATVAVVTWQVVVAPVLLGASAKALAWHPIRDMGLFEALLGWVWLDGIVRASHAAGLVVGLVVLVGLGALGVRRSSDPVVSLVAVVALAGVASVVIGRFVFDAQVVLRDERQLLPVRLTATALVVVGVHRLAVRTWRAVAGRGAGGGDSVPRTAGPVTLAVVVLVSALVGTRPWFVRAPGRDALPPVLEQLAAHPDAVVMSNAPTVLYRQAGTSALAMLQPREPTTLEAVDVAGELSSLAQAMRDDGRSTLLSIRFDDYYLAVIDPTWFGCATLVERVRGEGVEVSLVDIGDCADPANVAPVPGSPIDAP